MSGTDKDGPEPSITGAAFWALMGRWSVPDDVALRLIAGPSPTRAGRRPRFRLRGEQIRTYAALRAIDEHLVAMNEQPASWLARRIGGQPFGRKKPLMLLGQGPHAVFEVLRYLEREVFRASLRGVKPRRP